MHGPVDQNINITLRNAKKTISTVSTTNNFLLSKSFPYKDYSKTTCRRHSDMDFTPHSSNQQVCFPSFRSTRLNVTTTDKHNEKPNLFTPQPHIKLNISQFGEQSNSRI